MAAIARYKQLGRQLEETPLAPDQTVRWQADGRAVVTANVARSWQLRWWLLSALEASEVLEPASYRRQFADLLKVSAQRYMRKRPAGKRWLRKSEHGRKWKSCSDGRG